MPKSRVSRKKMFREFSMMDKKFLKDNFLRNIHLMYEDAKQNYGLGRADVDFLLFIYDYEFFTMEYVAKAMGKSFKHLRERLVFKMARQGYVYKHFDKLTPSVNMEDHFFREETKYNYRVRYALSQKGRMFVATMLRRMRGEEPFRLSSPDERSSSPARPSLSQEHD